MKRKLFKGTTVFLLLGILFFGGGVIGAISLVESNDVATYKQKNYIFDQSNRDKVVVKIENGYGPLFEDEKGNRQLHIVQLEDGNSYFFETMKNDKVFNDLGDNKSNEIVIVKEKPSKEIYKLYSSDKIPADYKQNLRRNVVLKSLSAGENSFSIWIFLGIGAVFFAIGIWQILQNQKSYNELFNMYPELVEDNNILENNAIFSNSQLGLYLYKNHLISTYKGIKIISAYDISLIGYTLYTYRVYFIPTNRQYYFTIRTQNHKELKMYFKYISRQDAQTGVQVNELFNYLLTINPNIEFI